MWKLNKRRIIGLKGQQENLGKEAAVMSERKFGRVLEMRRMRRKVNGEVGNQGG